MTTTQRSMRHAQAGFTILELMVAMTISLFIISALAAVVIGASATSKTRERASDLQVNGRYAIDTMRRDLQHAGYLGISSLFYPDQPISQAATGLYSAITVTNVCDNNNVGKLSQRIWGSNDANPFAATCIPAADYLRGDVIVIRGLNPMPTTTFVATSVYYHSAYEGGAPFAATTPPDFTGSNKQAPYLSYPLEETVYYVAPYTTTSSESPKVPALWRLRLGTGPAMIPELVASGVENMQIRYGVFQTNDTVRYLAANDVPASDWDLVRSVEVTLLMRAATAETGYSNNTTYTLSGATYGPVSDSYPRLVMGALMQQRN